MFKTRSRDPGSNDSSYLVVNSRRHPPNVTLMRFDRHMTPHLPGAA